MLSNVVNIVTGSSKRLLELQIAYGIEVDKSVASGEREIGRGLNQIGNLQRPGSTRWTTTERVFSAMKLMKTGLRNKMEEEYLRDSMLINIEREYAENIDVDEVIDEFYAQKNHRVQLK
ncbi:hypothetical protein DCAR_0831700 [Daucus carota subsp. sativus]|uniref:Uncharacterized protein n=1 Tax=Daucus carota subsp. sativus TaxID=79200 RepID=A0AAF1BAF7_DAUCS|nr:hypothetical protein DCAR_0831700 [Daucus carota subsp. sativus]